MGHKTKNKDTVLTKIGVHKGITTLLLTRFERISKLEKLSNKVDSVRTEAGLVGPVEEGADAYSGDEDEPKPEEYKDFFIKHIYRKDALDSVAMAIGQFADFEIAKRDAREVARLLPQISLGNIADEVEAIEGVVRAQYSIH